MSGRRREVHTVLDRLPVRGRCGDDSMPASPRAMVYRLVLGAVLPQFLYYAGVRLRLSTPAILAVVTWTAALALYNVRRSSVSPFVLYGAGVTVAQGAAALLLHHPLVFAAGSIVENVLDGLGFLASVAVGQPFAAVALKVLRRLSGRALLPATKEGALRRLTLLWSCLFLLRGAGLYVALIHLPLGSFLVVSVLAGWPITIVGAAASLAYLRGAQLGNPDRSIPPAAHFQSLHEFGSSEGAHPPTDAARPSGAGGERGSRTFGMYHRPLMRACPFLGTSRHGPDGRSPWWPRHEDGAEGSDRRGKTWEGDHAAGWQWCWR